MAGIGTIITYQIFSIQRCDSLRSEALDFHTENRKSTLKSVERSLLAKFKKAANACGPNHDLHEVLYDWHIMPDRCSGKKDRGTQICSENIETMKLLNEEADT